MITGDSIHNDTAMLPKVDFSNITQQLLTNSIDFIKRQNQVRNHSTHLSQEFQQQSSDQEPALGVITENNENDLKYLSAANSRNDFNNKHSHTNSNFYSPAAIGSE